MNNNAFMYNKTPPNPPKAVLMIYHGSPYFLQNLTPKPSILLGGKEVVYGTPSIDIAVLFSARWKEDDFLLGYDPLSKKIIIEERYPNAVEAIYKGKGGYIYVLDPIPFIQQEGLWSEERVCYCIPKIVHIQVIEDIYMYIKRSTVYEIKPYLELSL